MSYFLPSQFVSVELVMGYIVIIERKGDWRMAFGIKRADIQQWKKQAARGELAFLTHFWYDERFPECHTVTKAACSDREKLIQWGKKYGLKAEWIHDRHDFPHFDLLGSRQREILMKENLMEQLIKLEQRMERKGSNE